MGQQSIREALWRRYSTSWRYQDSQGWRTASQRPQLSWFHFQHHVFPTEMRGKFFSPRSNSWKLSVTLIESRSPRRECWHRTESFRCAICPPGESPFCSLFFPRLAGLLIQACILFSAHEITEAKTSTVLALSSQCCLRPPVHQQDSPKWPRKGEHRKQDQGLWAFHTSSLF